MEDDNIIDGEQWSQYPVTINGKPEVTWARSQAEADEIALDVEQKIAL